jgi:peptidoglycan/LPS O-acetylase OafA/YrhL
LWPWVTSFSTDIYTFFHPDGIRSLAPLWSLAVQEQFYLVWPWLVFFLPRRWLVPLLVTFLFAAPVFRRVASFHFDPHVLLPSQATIQVLPTSVIDSLAIGALIALARRDELRNSRATRPAVAVCATAFLILLALAHYGVAERAKIAFGDTALAVLLGVLVLTTSKGIGGPIGRVLDARPIVYLGTISYGIYIFHMLVPTAYNTVARHWNELPDAHHGLVYFCLTSVMTILVATMSWELLERPISDLKRFFPYGRPAPLVQSRDHVMVAPAKAA